MREAEGKGGEEKRGGEKEGSKKGKGGEGKGTKGPRLALVWGARINSAQRGNIFVLGQITLQQQSESYDEKHVAT